MPSTNPLKLLGIRGLEGMFQMVCSHKTEVVPKITPAKDIEICITTAMIEAGRKALYDRENDPAWTLDEDRVSTIYRAMEHARLKE